MSYSFKYKLGDVIFKKYLIRCCAEFLDGKGTKPMYFIGPVEETTKREDYGFYDATGIDEGEDPGEKGHDCPPPLKPPC